MGITIEQARAAKSKLIEQVAGQPWVSGIGISKDERGYLVRLLVGSAASAKDVPGEIDGVPVIVVDVGIIRAHGG